jgi:ribosomal-protein-alanine N-acetyltransferase
MTKAQDLDKGDFVVERAQPEDLDDILQVMRHWNMHHVPSPEMPALDLDCMFIARVDGRIVGAAGYELLSPARGKTTLMGVAPEFLGTGIGKALQDERLRAMATAGAKTVTTNADRPASIRWYKKHYGYREVGTLSKLHSFGSEEIDSWTTLEMNLEGW